MPSFGLYYKATVIKLAFVVAVQSSVVSDSVTPWTAARQASLSFTVSRSLLKLISTESVMTKQCGTMMSKLCGTGIKPDREMTEQDRKPRDKPTHL